MAENNDDRSMQLRSVTITFIPVVLMTLILRCYMRGRVIKALGWDDALMILAFGFFILHVTCLIGGSFYGIGRKIGPFSDFQSIAVAVKYLWIAQLGYGFSTVICKISVCVFLMRLTVKPFQIRLLCILLGDTVIQGFYVIIADLVRCQPISNNWNRMIDPHLKSTCISDTQNKIIAYVATGNLLIIDVSIGIILPVMIVWGLQMPKANKIAVLSILCLTISATVAIIVRIPYMDGYAETDALYAAVDMLIWAYIELSLGIIAGNLATLGPLFRTWFGLASSRGNSASTTTTPKPKRSFRRPRGIHDLSFAMSTLNETMHSASDADKTTITVTHVDNQSHPGSARDANTSQEQLTLAHRGIPTASNQELTLGPGIYREREAQTSDVESVVHLAGECV
ncbi:hypothetical protein BDW74DRAFT_175990 [Aspergillus multicolor]|uniref:putative integral membrane protein n=1 Tax=Aspergillus multicolor TaxID=41759 RepID=UPI003CCDCD7A